MGELEIVSVYPDYGPSGYQYALLTVFFTWAPLAVAGIGLKRTRVVHATMRGAAALGVLARLAMAIEVAALLLTMLIAVAFLIEATVGFVSSAELYGGMIVGVTIVAPCVALNVFGIRGWHHVLADLSHRGESRMLV
jgi:hypothetical protein